MIRLVFREFEHMRRVHFIGILCVLVGTSACAHQPATVETRQEEFSESTDIKKKSGLGLAPRDKAMKDYRPEELVVEFLVLDSCIKMKNPEKIVFCMQAAKEGSAAAQMGLATLYREGELVEQDYTAAVEWLKRAAEQGSMSAQYNLAIHYMNGHGVEKDMGEAVKWHRLSAEQGLMEAQYKLGMLYHHGDGVTKDLKEAEKWYRLALEQGHPDAEIALDFVSLETDAEKTPEAE